MSVNHTDGHRPSGARTRGRLTTRWISLLLLLVGLGLGWISWRNHHAAIGNRWDQDHPVRSDPWPESEWENARPGVNYVGDAVCGRCHAEIAGSFRRHPMGQSLAPIATGPAVGVPRPDGSIRFQAGLSEFTIERRAGREMHRETRRDEQGRILAEVEAEVKYALGSGRRGVSYLVEHDGRLFQSPISWYSQKQRWDLSPGYERRNHHFERPIEPQCLYCHANRVEPVALSINAYQEPLFRGHAIGCERCHGPGELHARRRELVGDRDRDRTIVNPRHLAPSLRAAVCEQCHLLGDYRVERPGRAPFDYRPGLPSIAFFAVYDRADQGGDRAVGHVAQMKASRCYRESRGGLGCTSCHDPHQVPAPEEKTAYFRQQCLTCHDRQGCSLPEPTRLARSPDDRCTQCHMPISPSSDIAHIAITDHRILRTPRARESEPAANPGGPPLTLWNGELLGPEAAHDLDRELAIALTLAARGLKDSPKVRQQGAVALALLDRAITGRPDDLAARLAQAQALALSGRTKEAIPVVASVLRSAPGYEQALDDSLTYAIERGDIPTARAAARQAVALNPWSAAFHERLAYLNLQDRNGIGTVQEAQVALRLNPFLRFARMFAIEGLLHRNDLESAAKEFAILTRLNPSERESLQRWFAGKRGRAGE